MTIQESIELAKAQIGQDVSSGIVPVTCASFSELHDYADANEYGGLCGPDMPILADDDSNLAECHAHTDFCNAVQDALDRWIKSGGLRA